MRQINWVSIIEFGCASLLKKKGETHEKLKLTKNVRFFILWFSGIFGS